MAEELIDALVPDQAPVAEGEFTLDLAAAQAKLERYRLADSEYFVLLLVEVGHRLPGCTSIWFETGYYSSEIRLVGVELDDESLARLAEPSVAVDISKVEPRAAALELLARVLAGIVVARQFKQIEVGVNGAREVLRFDAQGVLSVGEARATSGGVRLWISLRERPRIWVPWGEAAERLEHRWRLVRERCRYARVPVYIDGERVDGRLSLAEAEVCFPVDEDGEVVAHVGHSLARFEATLILLCHGVVIESLVEPELGTYRVAEVDVSDLPRDLSLTKLLDSEALAARLERVRAALRELPTQGLAPPIFIGESTLDEVARNFGLAFFTAIICPPHRAGVRAPWRGVGPPARQVDPAARVRRIWRRARGVDRVEDRRSRAATDTDHAARVRGWARALHGRV